MRPFSKKILGKYFFDKSFLSLWFVVALGLYQNNIRGGCLIEISISVYHQFSPRVLSVSVSSGEMKSAVERNMLLVIFRVSLLLIKRATNAIRMNSFSIVAIQEEHH